MEPITEERNKKYYEITPDGRMKVNISELLQKRKVRDFYKSIKSQAPVKKPSDSK
jgi:hypothetical protein